VGSPGGQGSASKGGSKTLAVEDVDLAPPWARAVPSPGSPHRPKYKGKYCVGERKRFRLCNLQACPPGRPSFRHVQCSHFDAMLYKGQLHTWVPVVNDGESCCPQGHRLRGQGTCGPKVTQ
jgi:hypothetical protein